MKLFVFSSHYRFERVINFVKENIKLPNFERFCDVTLY